MMTIMMMIILESNIWITICDVMIGVVVQIITRVIILERCRGVFKVINIILYSAIFTICCPLLPILLFHLIGGGLFKISMTSKIFSSFVTVIASFFFYKDQLTSLVYQFSFSFFFVSLTSNNNNINLLINIADLGRRYFASVCYPLSILHVVLLLSHSPLNYSPC